MCVIGLLYPGECDELTKRNRQVNEGALDRFWWVVFFVFSFFQGVLLLDFVFWLCFLCYGILGMFKWYFLYFYRGFGHIFGHLSLGFWLYFLFTFSEF